MSSRHLVLGLDGADLPLMRSLGREALPALFRLMDGGAYSAQRSVMPPATLPNWTTFLTGHNPGRHGVFDFTTRKGTSVKFSGGTVRASPTIAARLDALGKACAVVGFPGTWPPEPLEHGIFISGWDSPVAFEADASFVHPQWLFEAITKHFGPMRFDDADEFSAEGPGWHETLASKLVQRIELKTELAKWILKQRNWELAAFYFGESDTAAHHLWSLHDPASPRHVNPAATAAGTRSRATGLARVYRALDAAVATLHDAVGEEAELTVVSDHGSGGASDKVLYLNRALEAAGLLTFKHSSGESLTSRCINAAKDVGLTKLPPKVREGLFRLGRGVLPSFVESQARFGAIDFAHTRAFSDELNYFPAIHLNLAGREPEGTVPGHDRDAVCYEVEAALTALRDPWHGQPVCAAVHRREDLFDGPHMDRAPDLVVELKLDGDYSYNLQPSATVAGDAQLEGGCFRRLTEKEFLGRKGRSLPGSHRQHGFYLAYGPSVGNVGEIQMGIADACATLLSRMGVSNVPDGDGRVLFEILASDAGAPTQLPETGLPTRQADPQSSGFLAKRLQALGYID